MAYGNFRSVAVEDNGPRRKKPEEEVSLESIVETTPYQQRQQEIKQGVNTATPVNYSVPTPVQETGDKEEEEQERRNRAQDRIKTQREADQKAAQQDAQNNAWRNIVENTNPQDLASNGQSIWNSQTGQQYSAPNYGQQKQQTQQEQPTSSYMPYGDPRKNQVQTPVEEETRSTAGNMVVPSTASTRTAAELEPQWGIVPQSRDYNEEEISQMTRDRNNLVVPRNYNQQENNKDNTTGVPAASENAELLEQWQNLIAQEEMPEQANPNWNPAVDTGSALGNGYVTPVTKGTPINAQATSDKLSDYQKSARDVLLEDITEAIVPGAGHIKPNLSKWAQQILGEWEEPDTTSISQYGTINDPNRVTSRDLKSYDYGEPAEYRAEAQAPTEPSVNWDKFNQFQEEGYAQAIGLGYKGVDAADYATQYALSKTGRLGYDAPGTEYKFNRPAPKANTSTFDYELPEQIYTENPFDSATPAELRAEAQAPTGTRPTETNEYGSWTTPERKRALEVAESMGLFGPEAYEYAETLLASGLYSTKPNDSKIKAQAEDSVLQGLIESEDWDNMTDAEKNAARQKAKDYAADVLNNYRVGTPQNQRFDARLGVPQTTSTEKTSSQPSSAGYMPYGDPRTKKTETTTSTPQTTGDWQNDYAYNSAMDQAMNEGYTPGTLSFADRVEEIMNPDKTTTPETILPDENPFPIETTTPKTETKAERLERMTQELLGTNREVVPNTGNTNMKGGWSLEELMESVNPDKREAIRQGQAVNALDALGDLTIPKGVDAYMATDRWSSAGNLGTLILGYEGLDATANPQNVETINATQEEMINAVKALVEANPELQKLIDSGQVEYSDIIRRYFKANNEMVEGATGFVDNVANGNGNSYKNGYTYSTPSYKQDMPKVVKAPYKQGGYTTAELEAMGNKPYTDRYGNTQYEGYYQWGGVWYPVDQEKAAYYLKNGTYNGWDEGMRDYYNTFGTFKGYTPNWKNSSYNRSYGGNSYSYSGGSGSGYNPYEYYTPPTTLQQAQRINNIMKNWTF